MSIFFIGVFRLTVLLLVDLAVDGLPSQQESHGNADKRSDKHVSGEELQGVVDGAHGSHVLHYELDVVLLQSVDLHGLHKLRRLHHGRVVLDEETVVDELEIDKLRRGKEQGGMEVLQQAVAQCLAEGDNPTEHLVAKPLQPHGGKDEREGSQPECADGKHRVDEVAYETGETQYPKACDEHSIHARKRVQLFYFFVTCHISLQRYVKNSI